MTLAPVGSWGTTLSDKSAKQIANPVPNDPKP